MTEVATATKPPFELLFDGGFIGDACSTDSPCSAAFDCLVRFDSGAGAFPDGYCSAPCPKHTCFDHLDYPWSRCVTFPGLATPACMIECRSNSDCRDGYVCGALPKSNRNGDRYVCVPSDDAATAALEALQSATPEPSSRAERSDAQPGPVDASLAESDELIRFNDSTSAETGTNDSQPSDAAESPSSWIIPVSLGLVVLALVLVAIFRSRRWARGPDSNSSSASGFSASAVRRSPSTGRSQFDATNRARPKSASRPLVASHSPSRPLDLEPSTARTVDAEDSRVTPASRQSTTSTVVSSGAEGEQISDAEHSTRGVILTSKNDERDAGDRDRLRTQHLVPSLRQATNTAESDADETVVPGEHEKPQRAAWKPKRISDPSLSGFAPAAFSVRASLDSASTLSLPVPFELCLHIIDRLLQEANAFRVQRGYEDVLFIESRPDQVAIQLVDDHQIRVGIPERSLVKTTLATDRIRNHGFTDNTLPADAHFLSMMKFAAHLLGVDADAANFRSIPLLATYSESSESPIEHLIAVLSESGPMLSDPHHAPDATDDRLVELYRVTRATAQIVRAAAEQLRSARRDEEEFTELVCPACAAAVSDRSLACDSCGVPLHPSPFYCPACGRPNLLIADGREQQCVNSSCATELTRFVPAGELERRRMSIVFSLLSRFDDFQRLSPIDHEDRFMAMRDGRPVHIVQSPDTRSVLILESDRGANRVPASVALPTRVFDEGGLRFVVYDDVLVEVLPVRSLGALRLAESLFTLAAQLSEPGFSLCRATLDDLAVTHDGACLIRYGHRLPRYGAVLEQSHRSAFAAPEIRMGAAASSSADIYCAAAIWYATTRGVVYNGERLPTTVPDDLLIAPNVWSVLRACLDNEPSSRPPSVAKVLSSLRNEKTLSDLI